MKIYCIFCKNYGDRFNEARCKNNDFKIRNGSKACEEYAVSGFEACPFHKAGQVFVSDGEHKPEGLCEYAWKPIKEMVKILSEGELLQPRGTWMVDDDKGVFSCVDGLRPVIMLIEAIHADEDE